MTAISGSITTDKGSVPAPTKLTPAASNAKSITITDIPATVITGGGVEVGLESTQGDGDRITQGGGEIANGSVTVLLFVWKDEKRVRWTETGDYYVSILTSVQADGTFYYYCTAEKVSITSANTKIAFDKFKKFDWKTY